MVEIFVLGTIQDGGLPQIGCFCLNCKIAIKSKMKNRFRSSIAIKTKTSVYLVDATPDIEYQYPLLMSLTNMDEIPNRNLKLSGIILTHLHTGHYTGLVHLGKESASTRNLPVYMTSENELFIRKNKPYSYLIEREEIKPIQIHFDQKFIEEDNLVITPFEVPHRNEDGDTIGLNIRNSSTGKNLIYISDIDYLPKEIIKKFQTSNVIIFDGSFFSKNEISGQENVPHPPIKSTIEILGKNFHSDFYFTHINHTNPVLNSQSDETEFLTKSGYKLASEGLTISL
ncbi:MAG: MBL fold metallo-hydrolase [Candidatus Hodarchaeales archaeon]